MNIDFTTARILVLGDIILDEYIAADVARISPEAPVPVANLSDRWHVLGGAGNVARNLKQLGCQVTLAGLCGRDAAGELLQRLLDKEGIHGCLCTNATGITTQKTRIIAQGQQLLRIDQERVTPISQEQYDFLVRKLREIIPSHNMVILSDYAKGALKKTTNGLNLAQEVIAQCSVLGIPVCVDPKGKDWSRYAGAQCVTPNASEFKEAAELESEGRMDMEYGAAALLEKYGFEKLLVTLGSKGMALFSKDKRPLYIKAEAKEVTDVSGAGDTVVAVLAACRAVSVPWECAAHTANTAAGIVVSKIGTSPITWVELDVALHPNSGNPKMTTLNRLLDMAALWRRNHNSIVFTNGCFDILHKGHIHLLNEAAAQGDRLIVGINTDASVRRLKGPTRPVQDECSRALLVAAMEVVDAVIFFDQDTPLELITALQPDILVKGGDYKTGDIVGADLVTGRGGRVHIVNFIENISSTRLISKCALTDPA